jgi:methionine aminopeptidase
MNNNKINQIIEKLQKNSRFRNIVKDIAKNNRRPNNRNRNRNTIYKRVTRGVGNVSGYARRAAGHGSHVVGRAIVHGSKFLTAHGAAIGSTAGKIAMAALR